MIRTIPPKILAPNEDELSMGTFGPLKFFFFLILSDSMRKKNSSRMWAIDRRS